MFLSKSISCINVDTGAKICLYHATINFPIVTAIVIKLEDSSCFLTASKIFSNILIAWESVELPQKISLSPGVVSAKL